MMFVGHKGRQYICALPNIFVLNSKEARRELIHNLIEFLDTHRNKWLGL